MTATTEASAPAASGSGSEGGASGSTWLGRVRRALPWLVPIALLLIAGVLRFTGLGLPGEEYFDEVYYAPDSQQILEHGVEEGFVVHPPVGKWMMAAGIAVAGDDPYGWRVASAAVGTALVGLTYLVGLRLFRRSIGLAGLGALLVALDGLTLTMSRIAMLDIFLAFFVLLGFWLLLIDRDQSWAGAGDAGEDPYVADVILDRRHPYRWLAGLAFGLALATKWSGALTIPLAIGFAAVSELLLRHRLTGELRPRIGAAIGSIAAALILLPVAVYLTSYGTWFVNYESTRLGIEESDAIEQELVDSGASQETIDAQCPGGRCPLEDTSFSYIASRWISEQDQILGFHRTLEAEHPYRASSLTWPILARPVAYSFDACDDPANPPEGGCQVEEGNISEVLGIGNPAIWWPALLAYPALVFLALRRRDWRGWAIGAFLFGQYAPWVIAEYLPTLTDGVARPMFLFYATPIVPFIALALTYCAWWAQRSWAGRWLGPAIAVVAAAGFAFFAPIFLGTEISRPAWDLRILFQRWI